MPQLNPNVTISQYQQFVKEVYGLSNDRYFSLQDMLANVERFMTRSLKGIRKNDHEKIRINLIISLSWFMSMMNQLHIDIEEKIWERFPYLCSYCASCPCVCKTQKIQTKQKVVIDNKIRPKMFKEFQEMFNKIYPASKRTLDNAGVHLIEEMGETTEAILNYRGNHNDQDFNNIVIESADLMSCIVGVFNSLEINLAEELAYMFNENCHVCKKAPCTCSFIDIIGFKS